MVGGVKSDGALGPLEGPGGLNPRERCRDLEELAVGAGGLSPAKDASGPVRHLIALRSLSGEVVVRWLGSVGLRVLLVVVAVVVVPVSPSMAAAAAAAAAAPLLPLASLVRLTSLAKPLELIAVLGGMGMPVVVDAEGAIIFLLGARGWSGSAGLLGVRFSREDRSSLAQIGRASCRERVYVLV